MPFTREHIWKEISEKEYNKNIIVIPENTTSEQKFKTLFCFNPKEIVKRDIIIPKHITGILNVCDYVYSNEPKQYKYFKSIGTELVFYGSAESIKQIQEMELSYNSKKSKNINITNH